MTDPIVCTTMAARAAYEATLGPCGVCGAPLHVTWVTAPGMPAHHATPRPALLLERRLPHSGVETRERPGTMRFRAFVVPAA